MILLDTNVLSEPMRQQPDAGLIAWLDSRLVSELYICSIIRAEIELGLALLPSGKRKDALSLAVQRMFEKFSGRCLPFGDKEASMYARIVSGCRSKGRSITVEDAQIASVAICNDLVLATRNVKDFRMIENLRIINPFDH